MNIRLENSVDDFSLVTKQGNKHIVIVLPRLPVDHAMQSTVYAEILPDLGFDVTWLVTHSKGSDANIKNYKWKKSSVISFPVAAGVSIKLFSLVCALYNDLNAAIRSWQFCRFRSVSILQVRNDIFSAILHTIVSRLVGCKFVFQISFLFPEAFVEIEAIRSKKVPRLRRGILNVQRYFRYLAMRRSDCVLTISDEMKRLFEKEGIAADKMVPFPLGTNCPPLPSSFEIDHLRNEFTFLADGSPLILYFGAIERIRQLEFVIYVAEIVFKKYPDARWIFLGHGPKTEFDRLIKVRDALGLKEVVHFVDRVPREQVNIYLKIALLSVSPIPITNTFVVSSPTKTLESLAVGCPVVGTPIPDQADLLEKSKGGLIAPFQPDLFARAVEVFLGDPVKARQMGQDGMQYVRRERSYRTLGGMIGERYADMIGINPGRSVV